MDKSFEGPARIRGPEVSHLNLLTPMGHATVVYIPLSGVLWNADYPVQ